MEHLLANTLLVNTGDATRHGLKVEAVNAINGLTRNHVCVDSYVEGHVIPRWLARSP